MFVVAWIASMLIYPRYKIHQLASVPGEPLFDTMAEASNRLRRIIMSPSIVLVWLLGVGMLITNPALLNGGWIYLKIALVLVLSGVHGYFVALGKRIDAGDVDQSVSRRLRLLNEVPFLLMIVIVILVVLRPF